jgi:hypothetical protein
VNSGETTLIAQINESWRVLRIADRPGWGSPSWSIQQQVDGVWCGKAVVRPAHMLREMVKAWCGRIDPDAAAILEALPKRCDRDPTRPPWPDPPKKKQPRPPREPAVKATPTPAPTGKRAALASKFLQWRDGQPVDALAGSQAIPAPQAENNAQAPRAASALQQAEAMP